MQTKSSNLPWSASAGSGGLDSKGVVPGILGQSIGCIPYIHILIIGRSIDRTYECKFYISIELFKRVSVHAVTQRARGTSMRVRTPTHDRFSLSVPIDHARPLS